MSLHPAPALSLWPVRSFEQAGRFLPKLRNLHAEVAAYRDGLTREAGPRGYSVPAGRMVEFGVDWPADGTVPVWRETLVCPVTGLNARLRAAYHAFLTLRPGADGDRIYLTEAATAFHRFLAKRHDVLASDYLPGTPTGSEDARGVRSEDLTGLTFANAVFDVLMSFEVLEHVPDYRAALRECARVLRPGGLALLTAPFAPTFAETLVRASVAPDGNIVHHEPPEYHGDPVTEGGILCYYWFGWSLLDELRAAGFRDVHAAFYQSRQFGYLEPAQAILVATRQGA